MNPNITFETALQLLLAAHAVSVLLLLATSEVCLAVIESLEGTSKSGGKPAD